MKKSGIDDILPTAPLQEGLLCHSLYDSAAVDIYTSQMTFELTGALDVVRQLRGLTRRQALPTSMTDLADDHIAAMRTVRPAGPYRLLGWSQGGNIAHAAAVRLQQAGDKVELLALLDAYSSELQQRPNPRTVRAEVGARLRETPELRDHAGTAVEAIVNCLEICQRHAEETLRGDAPFFAAARGRKPGPEVANAWRAYVDGDIELHEIPCDHDGMLQAVPIGLIGEIVAARLGEGR